MEKVYISPTEGNSAQESTRTQSAKHAAEATSKHRSAAWAAMPIGGSRSLISTLGQKE